ncbi:hypothetical protein TrLO_g9496 [Triparma laevis f. longispina]|nr:hypothetical protein TrLO_g9496 [Triparma laevis f. longispina]
MSHLLWGPDWDDPVIQREGVPAPGSWDPIETNVDPITSDGRLPWEPKMNCSKSEAMNRCVSKAHDICTVAFNETFHKFENKAAIEKPVAIGLSIMVMMISISYALYVENLHRKRARVRSLARMELSMSSKRLYIDVPDGSADSPTHAGGGGGRGHSKSKISPEAGSVGAMFSQTMSAGVLDDKVERFFKLITNIEKKEIAGTIQWWDCNFEEQEMEDMYRRSLLQINLVQLRCIILGGLFATFAYQYTLISSRADIFWELRLLLATYCLFAIPFTFKEKFNLNQSFAEVMFSNVMIFVSIIFLLIAYLDKFAGTPTDAFLMMTLVIMFQITIMYVTGTVWFRKMLINLAVVIVYMVIAKVSVLDCIGFDQFLNGPSDPERGEGKQISEWNAYPTIQIIPDYDSFKYNMSCTNKTENFNFVKQLGFVCVTWALTAYTGYYFEKQNRIEFGKKWWLLQTKIDMEKKIKNFHKRENMKKEAKMTAFGEIRDLTFKSPMMKVLTTIEKIKLAVGDDDQVVNALKSIEDTLHEHEDLNKVDIQKQDNLTDKDKELAQFVMSTGGKMIGSGRDRVRSVPSLLPNIDSEKFREENGLITALGLPNGQKFIGAEHVAMLEYLNKYEDWDFDAHKFTVMSGGRPIYFLLMKHLDRFHENYQFDLECLKNFAIFVEDNYCFDPDKPNAYHTNLHGTDVMQTVGCLIKNDFINNKLGSLEKLTALVAALMHDFRHKGVNNAFLVNSGDLLALVHNDSSVLERFHASELFLTLKNGTHDVNMNFLGLLSNEDFKFFRTTSIEMILSTDLSQGYKYISKFTGYQKKGLEKWGNKPEDILILLQMCLKVADVSHPSKELKAHKTWSVMITDEFFSQGDMEKANGFACSPLCDREKNFDIPKSQTGFIEFVVSPTIKDIATLLGMKKILENLKSNYRYWSELHEEHTKAGTLKTSYARLCAEVKVDQAERAKWNSA